MKCFKAIHLTDTHMSLSAGYRVDDIMTALENKFAQVKQYIDEHGVKACFVSGDIFNDAIGNRIPHSVVARGAKCFRSLGVPVYAISGNHDTHLGSIQNHPLNVLFNTGVLINVENQAHYVDLDESIAVIGWNHTHEKNIERFKVSFDTGVIHAVGLTHLVLGEKPGMFYNEPQYGIEEFTHSGVDVFLNGHIHSPLPIMRNTKGQMFCQPGALRRTNTASEEMDRIPQVTLLELFEDGTSKATYLPIKVQDDIFRDWKKDIKNFKKAELNKFIERAQGLSMRQDKDIHAIIKEADLEPEIAEILLEHIQ